MPLEFMRLIGRDLKNGCRPEWIDALRGLKTLRMGMYLDEYVAHDQDDAKTILRLPRVMLETASSTLTELTLTTEHLIYDRGEKNNTLVSPATTLFHLLLLTLEFDHLHTLELRGWAFEEEDLRVFLSRHTSTLRYLHLIDDNLHVPRWHPGRLMDNLGAALQLAGVELFRLSIPDPNYNPGADSLSDMASGSDAESDSSGEDHIKEFPAVCRTLPLQSTWDLDFGGDVLQQRANRVIRRARPGRAEPYLPK